MASDTSMDLVRSHDLFNKVARVFQERGQFAQQRFAERLRAAFAEHMAGSLAIPATPWDAWAQWARYAADTAERWVLFWDTLRQRGDSFTEQTRAGLPPVLHFDYEVVLDARAFARPVNYALVRITPPPGVTVDPARRPYVIIDPRAGHGPGIGGFKDDSQVGVALAAGHPVYFVIFFPEPEAGQTLLDVCAAEQAFVRHVRALHPESPKPVIVGNCQGGWAAMMLAASYPEETGPIVINGAPMSYWGGAWREGEGDNPMRYAGGLLGGTWLASLAADLGHGRFDGAWLVQNFENLNPANTFWDKYYHLWANIDSEPPRFLDFERWWGGFYLLNRKEIEWITRNLFVGNQLWAGGDRPARDGAFDLRAIKAPIILFASMGDNITPPQQAFNWVADVYGSTAEIKARGQVIVGLLHRDVGHLGIFVSGKVAKREHAQIVSVLQSIEALPAGLYAMEISERRATDGTVQYDVAFVERELEDVIARLNRFKRADEKPFEAVRDVSDFNQRAYELFARPVMQAMSNEVTATMGRALHPLRAQRWAVSSANPWFWWLGPFASIVRAQRRPDGGADTPPYRVEQMMAEITSAALDYHRALRDAMSEAAFFLTYGNLFSFSLADRGPATAGEAGTPPSEARDLPFVREALAAIGKGGYAQAVARVAALINRGGERIPLARLELKRELAEDYADLLPPLAREEMRRIRGEQDIIVRYEPERALATLPALVVNPADRERLVALMERLLADERGRAHALTAEDRARADAILGALGAVPATPRS